MKEDITFIYVVAKYAKKGRIPLDIAIDMIISRILRLWNIRN